MKKILLSLFLMLMSFSIISAQNCNKVYLNNKEAKNSDEIRSKYIVILANKSNILLMSFIKADQKLYLNLFTKNLSKLEPKSFVLGPQMEVEFLFSDGSLTKLKFETEAKETMDKKGATENRILIPSEFAEKLKSFKVLEVVLHNPYGKQENSMVMGERISNSSAKKIKKYVSCME